MRKKLIKILSLTFGILILIVIAALISVLVFTNATVGTAISKGASSALGVGVKVESVKLMPFKQQITLENLIIDNPEGYENKIFLDLEQGDISLHTNTLLSDTIRIQHLDLKGVRVVMEQKGLTSNIQDIVDAINAQSNSGTSSGKKMVIEQLDISDITVKVKLIPLPGKTDTVPLKLSPIRMKNLGEKKALSTAELTSRIILAIVGGILEQAVDILPNGLVNLAGSAIGTTAEVIGTGVNAGKNLIGSGVNAGASAIKGAGKFGGNLIGGLLGQKKEDANTPQE